MIGGCKFLYNPELYMGWKVIPPIYVFTDLGKFLQNKIRIESLFINNASSCHSFKILINLKKI